MTVALVLLLVVFAAAHALAGLYRGDIPERRQCLTAAEISAAQRCRDGGWWRRWSVAHVRRCWVCREHWRIVYREFTVKGEPL